MSGSGGGGGGSISNEDIACENLKFEAQVASPNPAVVPSLTVNEVLRVTVTARSGIQEVQVYTAASQLVGGLLANRVSRLRECILNGTSYTAKVIAINGGQVRVFVEHA